MKLNELRTVYDRYRHTKGTLHFPSLEAKILWDTCLVGQISDGEYENTSPDWKFWSSLDAVADGKYGWEANNSPIRTSYAFRGSREVCEDEWLAVLRAVKLGLLEDSDSYLVTWVESPHYLDEPDAWVWSEKGYKEVGEKFKELFGDAAGLKDALESTGYTKRDVDRVLKEVRESLKTNYRHVTKSSMVREPVKETRRRKRYVESCGPDCEEIVLYFERGDLSYDEAYDDLIDAGVTDDEAEFILAEAELNPSEEFLYERRVRERGPARRVVRDDDTKDEVYREIEDLTQVSKHLTYLSAAKAVSEQFHVTVGYAMEVAKDVADDYLDNDAYRKQHSKAKSQGVL